MENNMNNSVMNTVNNNKNMTNVTFMAFAKGKESTEGVGFKKYVGIAPVHVIAVNPTKKELEKIYGTELNYEPEYIRDNNGVKQVQIDFIVKTDKEKCGVETISKVTFYIDFAKRVGSNSGKTQIIDKYGETAWATPEELASKSIPMYSNGPATIDKDYRPVYAGEDKLTDFIKAYLNIPNVRKYVNGAWEMVDNPDDCEARLESVANYFKGDFTELKEVIALQPTNKVKVMFGVKHGEKSDRQTIFNEKFFKNGVTDYSSMDKVLKERKNAGAYSMVDFEVCPLKEYVVEATNFNNDPVAAEEAPAECPW